MTTDAEMRELATVLRELAWTIHRTAPERAGFGPLPISELTVLKQVIETPGATVGELSQALGLRQPNTSAAVRELVGRGMLARETSPTDGRVVRVVATEHGMAEHRAISDAWSAPVEHAVERLDPADRAALAQGLGALRALHAELRAG